MLNAEINEFSATQELTQVASYFSIIDNAIKASDTNKKYKISTNNCEASPAPFAIGSWTTVTISPQGQNIADLYNSFITVEFDLGPFKNSSSFPTLDPKAAAAGYKEPGVWLGFKDAMDCVEQYQLVANGQTFYTQAYATEESYITSLASTEMVKSVDAYSKTRHEDVWNGNLPFTGFAMTKSTLADSEHKFKVKIDIRRFLPLATIKYILEFVGTLQIRIKFSLDGLDCAPLGFDGIAGCPVNVGKMVIKGTAGGITNKFVPYSELEAGNVTGVTALTYDSTTNAMTVTCGKIEGAGLTSNGKVVECKSHIACFGLDQNIYNQLAARYEQQALSFPIQVLTFLPMNGKIDHSKWSANGGSASVTCTAVPRFLDSIFFLFPKDSNYRTCYDNILSSAYSLKMGGYGTFPEVSYSTYSPEFLEVSSNVYNVNNDLTGFNKDVLKSMVNSGNNTTGFVSNDTSNFILSVPTSTDNTFQQGQTSNTTINYQLLLTLDPDSPIMEEGSSCVPLMAFLKDSVLAIQRRPGGAPPIVTLDEYDITTPTQ